MRKTYYIDFGGGTVYINATGENHVSCLGKTVLLPSQKLADFLATARELGFKAGSL